jgi:hypothetical protein
MRSRLLNTHCSTQILCALTVIPGGARAFPSATRDRRPPGVMHLHTTITVTVHSQSSVGSRPTLSEVGVPSILDHILSNFIIHLGRANSNTKKQNALGCRRTLLRGPLAMLWPSLGQLASLAV